MSFYISVKPTEGFFEGKDESLLQPIIDALHGPPKKAKEIVRFFKENLNKMVSATDVNRVLHANKNTTFLQDPVTYSWSLMPHVQLTTHTTESHRRQDIYPKELKHHKLAPDYYSVDLASNHPDEHIPDKHKYVVVASMGDVNENFESGFWAQKYDLPPDEDIEMVVVEHFETEQEAFEYATGAQKEADKEGREYAKRYKDE